MRKRKLNILYTILGLGFFYLILITIAFIRNNLPLNSPPGFGKRVLSYYTTNVAETSDNPLYPEMKTPVLNHQLEKVYPVLKSMINEYGWKIEKDVENKELEAVATTKVFKFKDDIKVRLEPDGNKTKLYIRSSSRVGKGDMGTNERRVLNLIDELEKKL